MNIEDKNDIINNTAKLYWVCTRRGMLELDVLLGNFLKDIYFTLPIAHKIQFVSLLACKDPEIFAWLMGHEDPTDSDLLEIVTLIRKHARPHF